jgi:dolichol-phosphate mannosyltransferase
MLKLAIATPTYNEAKNIPLLIKKISKTVGKLKGVNVTLLVIDDNSPDKTADIAEQAGKQVKSKNFKVEVLRRKGKDGFGKAYVHGFKELLKKDYDFILQTDADLSHDPKYIPKFVALAADNEFVVGSRYVKGGATPDWGWHRKLLSRGGNMYTRAFLGSKITDYTGGFNLYSADLLNRINIDTLQAGGYGFLIELKYRALGETNSVAQVPIVFMDRQHGSSKIPKSTIIKNFVLVPKIRKQRRKSAK